MNIDKQTLQHMLDIIKASPDATLADITATDAFQALNDAAIHPYLTLIDRNQYDATILWNGPADVRNLVEGGTYEYETQNMSDDEFEDFCVCVANRVDWKHVEEQNCLSGNETLKEAMRDELKERELI